ncbi:kynureninase [Pseudomarimonas salicorniae]|uniref:Kynureninase n=1 Tax=Pseudomarimonas salicorniae TaxID=2933270 RepID=A0ABT0GKZ8_9GAMM|nr:kynureninase [Lysobacter sp. CAU 1642]MCK7595219.1 kynureninase [Lysobacter sp. CAU 1642]
MSLSAFEDEARQLDAADPLARFRDAFLIPPHDGSDMHYFVGNSLGLMPRATRGILDEVMRDWAQHAVEGHFAADNPWMHYHGLVREPLAELVGAKPLEVVAMNTLTVNLHLMMVSFYRPRPGRSAILIEAGAFPSDRHAVESQIRFHGLDPASELIEVEPDADGLISHARFEEVFGEHGQRIALALFPGVQYRTGQFLDIPGLTALARKHGCAVGWDLAHAVGNLPLSLHDSGADFAVWCHYKYCNSGPGAIAGCFVHERHAGADVPRFAGWWGHDPATRFLMKPDFVPAQGADGWQLSNPPVLSLAPLRASLDLFHQAEMGRLRAKSLRITGFLERGIDALLADTLEILTPRDPARRGCQLSLRVRGGREHGRSLFESLKSRGVLGDWREPDVIRISPAPLYNRYADVVAFLRETLAWRDRR